MIAKALSIAGGFFWIFAKKLLKLLADKTQTKKLLDYSTMSLVSNNIKYLRRLHNLTQEQFSRRIGIKRSLVGAYEEARANPNLDNLMIIGRTFGVSVDSLLKHDLRRIRDTPNLSLPLDDNSPPPPPPLLPRDTPEPSPLSAVIEQYYRDENFYGGSEKKTLSIEEEFGDDPFFEPKKTAAPAPPNRVPPQSLPKPIDPNTQVTFNGVSVQLPAPPKSQLETYTSFNNSYEAEVKEPKKTPAKAEPIPEPAAHQVVQLVRHAQFNEYLEKYQQGEFVSKLPTFQLPMLPPGNYRAFEANGDFEFKEAYLIGQFVRNWYEISDALHYFLVIRGRGFLYRRVYNQVKIKGVLLLTSDNSNVGSFEVPIKDVLEVWEIKSFISASLPQPAASFERIRQLVDELHHELDRFKSE